MLNIMWLFMILFCCLLEAGSSVTTIEEKISHPSSSDRLVRLIYCSMASFPGEFVRVTYQKDRSLAIDWTSPSDECQKLSTGLWIGISESNRDATIAPLLHIPEECLEARNSGGISIVLDSAEGRKDSTCRVSIARLLECRSYTIEVSADYDSLQGRVHRVQVFTKDGDSSSGPLMMEAIVNSSSVNLKWEDRSGCAARLTSVALKLYRNDDKDSLPVLSLLIPRRCLSLVGQRVISLSLSSNENSCVPADWESLERCRTHTLHVESEYSASWRMLSPPLEIFTAHKDERVETYDDLVAKNRTTRLNTFRHFECLQFTRSRNMDTKYCDSACLDGFRCNSVEYVDWCLPKERVCDGQRDCLFDEFLQDSIDETSYCEDQLTQCERMTQPKGNFSKDDEGYPRKSTFLISVKHGHVIWFTFDCLCTSAVSNAPIVKVYDGMDENSPILLSHYGCNYTLPVPYSVRSSSNNLLVVYPSISYSSQPAAHSYYTSMESDDSLDSYSGIYGD